MCTSPELLLLKCASRQKSKTLLFSSVWIQILVPSFADKTVERDCIEVKS